MIRAALPAVLIVLGSRVVAGAAEAGKIDFAHQIVPILKEHCAKCHAGDKRKGGFSINTRELVLEHGKDARSVVPGKAGESPFISLLTSADEDERMPQDAPPLSAEEVALLRAWVDQGVAWEPGFTFGEKAYEPPLEPRRPELPPVVDGAENPIDRFVAAYYAQHKIAAPPLVDDAAFVRRLYFDLIGLPPTPEQLDAFVADTAPDKRDRLVASLLTDNRAYAVHWLTFWNDLLRNDYRGTGYIDGGRKQITPWLYRSLAENKPYDRFVRELINPTGESDGFINGIKWRGRVNASQTREVQFSQNISQVFLGINMKCASCHDSFIDDWKLTDAYALAAITADQPIEIHRCDVPTGETAKAAFIFPSIGEIDAAAPRGKRLEQLAALMTDPKNGRTTRTMVNRLWHRMMGRGIVQPVDAMGTPPWDADLLDYLAVRFSDDGYDLRKMLALIATSRAYQSRIDVRGEPGGAGYVYAGPIARRMTAEQLMDAIWAVTGAGPNKIEAPGVPADGAPSGPEAAARGRWVWSHANASSAVPAGEQITLRSRFNLAAPPDAASLVITCDNQYTAWLNGRRIGGDEDWPSVEAHDVKAALRAGENELTVVAKNLGGGPNAAALFAELLTRADGKSSTATASGPQWQWTSAAPDGEGRVAEGAEWKPAVNVADQGFLGGEVQQAIAQALGRAGAVSPAPVAPNFVRAALVNSDPLMRSLGRPNREQVVTTRPDELSTLQALDLSNGEILTGVLDRGAKNLLKRNWKPAELIDYVYLYALSRRPTDDERSLAMQIVGEPMSEQGVSDLLWAVFMLPEFQLIR